MDEKLMQLTERKLHWQINVSKYSKILFDIVNKWLC